MADKQAAVDKAAEKAAKKKRNRKRAIAEILSTEESYVGSLTALGKIFIQPLSKMAEDPTQAVLTKEEIATVFSNIEVIRQLNETFMKNLRKEIEEGTEEKTNIGQTFLQFSQFFKMYTMYVNNYDKAVQFLKTIENRNKYISFRDEAIRSPECKQPGLTSFLIMPIQRIPRYKMLLEEVIKNTRPGHPDLNSLQQAAQEIAKVAKHINEEVNRQKNRDKIIEIEQMFVGVSLVSPTREFIRHGPLIKKCRSSNRIYEFFLFNDLIVYASSTGFGKLKLHRKIKIDNSFFIQELPDKPGKGSAEAELNRFQIVSSSKSFVAMATTPAEKKAWFADLEKQLAKLRQTISGKRAGAIMTSQFTGPAPVWQSDHSSNDCQICRRKFTMFYRRHHCRFCGGLVCNNCSLKRLKVPVNGKKESRRICDRCVVDFKNQRAHQCQSSVGSMASVGGNSMASTNGPVVVSSTPTKPTVPKIMEESEAENALMAAGLLPVKKSETPAVQPAPIEENNAAAAVPLAVGSEQSTKPAPKITRVMRMEHAYTSETEGELSVAAEECVEVLEIHVNGWWKGKRSTGEEGWFPSSYGYILDCYEAKYDYTATDESDLSFSTGDVVHLINGEDESGWWTGYKNGKTGFFPSNYFEKIALDKEEGTPLEIEETVEEEKVHNNLELTEDKESDSKRASTANVATFRTKLQQGGLGDITTADDTSSDDEEENKAAIASAVARMPTVDAKENEKRKQSVQRKQPPAPRMAPPRLPSSPIPTKVPRKSNKEQKAKVETATQPPRPPPISQPIETSPVAPKNPVILKPPQAPIVEEKNNTNTSTKPPRPPALSKRGPPARRTPPSRQGPPSRKGPPSRPKPTTGTTNTKPEIKGISTTPKPQASNSSSKVKVSSKAVSPKRSGAEVKKQQKNSESKSKKNTDDTNCEAKKRQNKIDKLQKLIDSLPPYNVKALKAKAQLAQLKAQDESVLNKKKVYSRRKKKKWNTVKQ